MSKNSWYILDARPSLISYIICKYFLQFGGLSFFSLDDLESKLSVFLLFFLITCAFGVLSKKPLPNPKSQCFLPVVFLA